MIAWLLGVAFALDLEEARDRATTAALDVERAEAELRAAQAGSRDALGANLPAVTGFASVSTGQGFTSFGFERPVQNQYGAGVEGRWVLVSPFQWGAAASARQAATGRRAMLQWARVDARREATVRYAEAWSAQQQEAARTRALEDAQRAAEAVEGLVAAEIRPRADGARARADAATAAAELQTARWQTRATCASLLALLREPVDGTCSLDPPAWEGPLEGPPTHPALDAAQAALKGASADAFSATGALGPTVTATGTAAWYATDTGSGPGWSAGARAEMPLVASGRGWAGVAAAGARKDAATLSVEEQERALRVALTSHGARHAAALQAQTARQAALEASEQALTLVEERYRAGTVDLTAWMDARRTRDAAAVALARADAEVGTALAELEAARGVPGPP